MKNSDYKKKLNMEKEWYHQNVKKKTINKIASIFHTSKNHRFAFHSAKMEMKKFVEKKLKNKCSNILIAPCGTGKDYLYLKSLADKVYGIDISPEAVKKCPSKMYCKVEDILESSFKDSFFDLIASPLFFHHLLKVGFDQFLLKFYKMLKPGGSILILEPSIFYPLNLITRPIKKIFSNPFGEIEDESSFRPKFLIDALRRINFINIETQGATFSHVMIPFQISKIVNQKLKSLLKTRIVKNVSWLMIFWASKPNYEIE